MAVSIVFALLAGFCNALIVFAQHRASIQASPHLKGVRFALYLARNPLWLLGVVAILGAFLCQALALHGGQLSLVQPLLVSELIFALVLRRAWLRQSVSMTAWGAAAVTCVGLSVFILAAAPTGGIAEPSKGDWIWTLTACGGLTALLYLLGRTGTPARRAAFLATATAVLWSLEAAFIKMATNDVTSRGISGALGRWPVYALAIGGLLGFLVEQSALRAGPLSVSQPLMVIVDPIISVCLGVLLFEEAFTHRPGTLAAAAGSFVVLCLGALVLTRTTPADVAVVDGGAPAESVGG